MWVATEFVPEETLWEGNKKKRWFDNFNVQVISTIYNEIHIQAIPYSLTIRITNKTSDLLSGL